jgi:dimeric dUTPase (all-alpha-NTP-PPase superfamily)
LNLSKLFEIQKILDAKIIQEKNLGDMDRLPYLILALQVELGECANEWRGFKYWSKDMEPRTKKVTYPYVKGKEFHGPTIKESNPLLEEYVDCLHFILSIGLHMGIEDSEYRGLNEELTGILEAFQHTFNWIINVDFYRNRSISACRRCYENLVSVFVALGTLLGFTWDQIEQAYCDKNEVNHARQANGY